MFEFTTGYLDLDNEGEDYDYTTEHILTDKPDLAVPRRRLYKVHSKRFAASGDWLNPPRSFVPRDTVCDWTI